MFRKKNQADSSVLEAIKSGDEILIQSRSGWNHGKDTIDRVKVDRVTPTQIVIDRGHYIDRYDRRTGFLKGGSSSSSAIVDPTHGETVRVLAYTEVTRAQSRVVAAYQKWNRDSENIELIEAVREHADDLLTAQRDYDEIAAR